MITHKAPYWGMIDGKLRFFGTMVVEMDGEPLPPIPTQSSHTVEGEVIYWNGIHWRKLKRERNRERKARQKAAKRGR